MSKKDNRARLSRIRSAEYQHRKKVDLTIFWLSVFLYFGVPLIWYGAVEFGFVHKVENPDFERAAFGARTVTILVLLWYVPRAWHYFEDQKLMTEEDTESAEPSSSTS